MKREILIGLSGLILGIALAEGIMTAMATGSITRPLRGPEIIYGTDVAALQEEVRGLWKELREVHRDAKEGWELAIKSFRALSKHV